MRVFIALELPRETRKELGKIQQELKRRGIQARWVKPEQIHLTLAFLGSTSPDKIQLIKQILKEAVASTEPIVLHLTSVSCFPNPQKARIIYVALQNKMRFRFTGKN